MPWFNNSEITQIEIIKYKSLSDRACIAKVVINDPKAIQHLMTTIDKIPATGDLMKKPGPDSAYMVANFYSPESFISIEFLGKQIKTPSTGFNSLQTEAEIQLVDDINALLEPKINQRIPKIRGVELHFPGLVLTYVGDESIHYEDSSLTLHKDIFDYRTESGGTERIEILSGQLPPKPYAIDTGKKKIVIYTYESSDHQRLYPQYFQIGTK